MEEKHALHWDNGCWLAGARESALIDRRSVAFTVKSWPVFSSASAHRVCGTNGPRPNLKLVAGPRQCLHFPCDTGLEVRRDTILRGVRGSA